MVAQTDGAESVQRLEADHLVHFSPYRLQRILCSDWYCQNDLARLPGLDAGDRGTDGRAGGNTVVDDDHDTSLEWNRGAVAQVDFLAAMDFGKLALRHLI